MLSEVEIMTTQRNVKRVNVEDLTEAAIQKFFLKKIFFKDNRILKTNCLYIHFFKRLQAKSLQLSQK